MLDNLFFSINSVMPIFIIMAFGYFMKIKGFWDETTIKKMNKISFHFAIPFLLFKEIYTADMTVEFDSKLIIYAVLTTLILVGILWLVTPFFIKNKRSVGAFIQGCYRGNYAIIGIAVVSNILGESAKAVLITTFVIPVYNVLAVIILSATSEKECNIKSALMNIIKNPLIIGIVAGLPFSLLNIELPKAITSSIGYMAQLATPLALLAVGGSVNIKEMKENFKLANTAAFIKLVLVPLIFLKIAYNIGLNSTEDMLVLYVMYASPTAVNSFVMACNMDSDSALAADILLLTTLYSVVTFTVGIYIFRILNIL